MNATRKGLILAAIQILIVLSLGGKLLYDRATRPRAWALCQVYDPEPPIRGRYLGENLQMPAEAFDDAQLSNSQNRWYASQRWAYLQARDGKLIASSNGSGNGMWVFLRKNSDGSLTATSQQPVLIFVPDNFAATPRLKPGDQLWVEVTLPKQGPPRPIRLAVKAKDGRFTPVTTG
jgi:hypothetical protein